MPGGSDALAPAPTEPIAKPQGGGPQGSGPQGSGPQGSGPWRDLRARVISAAVLVPLALLCLWYGALPWALLIGAGTIGLAIEWTQLCGYGVVSLPALALVAMTLAGWGLAAAGWPALALVPVVLGGPAVWCVARDRGKSALSLAAGVPYIGMACVSLLWLRADAVTGLADVLLLLLIVWASDIGAYLVGRLVGGPRLAPVISPGKTWSGAAGGLLAAALVGGLAALGMGQVGLFWRIVLFATGLGIVAQAGDLMESAIKRRFGVKDSGWLIPGHGGLFDRLDAVLVAAPVAAALALALGRGVVLAQ
jgi:phosphatidate cytidylyltransferase